VGVSGATKRPVKVGVLLPEVERVATWTDLAAMARLAEDVGFDSVWAADHLLYRDAQHDDLAPWECWSVLAALAAITRRVELGPLVACANFHKPATLAKKAETVDEISGGRLILALGAGWNEPEFRAFDYPFDHRVSRFEEAFTVIRGLLRDGRVDFSGQYHKAPDCVLVPRGPRPGGPEIMVGTIGERMLRLCATYADSWNAWYSWFDNRPEALTPVLAAVDAACQAVGRDPATLARTCALLVRFPDLPGVTGQSLGGEVAPLAGTPENLAEALRTFARLGISHAQLVLDPNTTAAIEAMAPVLDLLDRG
jgi:alkanesulfonate monooxygenase SsuD/methylene tetrahydromethanopterin reductase-like flavin-dependent oxidoreductase (luciferase family)